MPINILCDKLSLYEYRGNLYLTKDLRKINVLKKKNYIYLTTHHINKSTLTLHAINMKRKELITKNVLFNLSKGMQIFLK